jgi:AraC family transcriptional regulator
MQTVIHETPLLRVLDYRCSGHVHGQGPEEEVGGYEVVLPREGFFVRHVRGETIAADPNHALFFNRSESYRVSHPVAGGDRCTVLAFATRQIQDCLEHVDPDALACETRLFRNTHTPTSPEFDLLHRRLLRAVGTEAEQLEVEEIAVNLLAGLICSATDSAVSVTPTSRRTGTTRRYDNLVARVKAEMSRRLGEKLDLAMIAASVHVSPYHLCRVFRSQTGFSLSSYHRRLRLRTALQRILDGENNLTELAVEMGFAHHSHFTSAFSREFGIPPSANRARLGMIELRTAASAIRSREVTKRKKTN